MSAAGQVPAARATALRAKPQKGVWRRLLALLGFRVVDARTEGLARRAEIGAVAEAATGAKLRILESRGWYVLHGRHVPGYRADLDHVLVPPNGLAVIVLDTKRWHARQTTYLKDGRVHCGGQDRHDQIEAVAGYAQRVQDVLWMPGVAVCPMVVVHGSRVAGEYLEAPVEDGGTVFVLGVERLVPELLAASSGIDSKAANALAARVERVLPPYPG